MDIGGRNDKKKDKDDWKKGKGKEKEIDEEEKPRNKNYMEDESKRKGKMISATDDGYDPPSSWDWRDFIGIISNVLDQGIYPICWAIAFIRAVEALFNIGKRLEHQKSFSIQHLINNVEHKKFGLEDSESLATFIKQNGVLEEGECSYKGVRNFCEHVDAKVETIDEFVIIDDVDDVEVKKLVWKHPVVGVIPLWKDFNPHKQGIFQPKKTAIKGKMNTHAVLIIGYGVDDFGNHYWIIQNSWGKTWVQEGFGQMHREHRRGRPSLFIQVYYGKKQGYPRKQKK